jgi:hypothetical protein
MATEKQINAARANGAKSRGPVTPEGKRISSMNRLRHGALARTIVLESESHEKFAALSAAWIEYLQPANPIERALVDTMITARWRLERLRAMETAGLSSGMRDKAAEIPDPATRAWSSLGPHIASFGATGSVRPG